MFDQCQIRKKIKYGISLKEMSMTSEHKHVIIIIIIKNYFISIRYLFVNK